jgi:F0F1-type ATP synthase beta subunit
MPEIYGEVVQIIGPVVDVAFNESNVKLPAIYDALELTAKMGQS